MREVTPYFQKAMLLADVGWEEARNPPFLSSSTMSNGDAAAAAAANDSSQSPNSEMKWTPLHLACISRDHGGGGGGGGVGVHSPFSFEIHSPNRKHALLLRVATANDFDYWFGLLASTIDGTVADSLIRANFALPFRVLKMGWMTQLLQENKSSSSYSSETSFDSGMSDNAGGAQSVFAAQSEVRVQDVVMSSTRPKSVTNKTPLPVCHSLKHSRIILNLSQEHLLMWDTVPWTVKEWSSSKEKISLVRTRVLSTRDQQARVNWLIVQKT